MFKRTTEVPGRNDLCPCGSGRKWKKCCGDKLSDQMMEKARNRNGKVLFVKGTHVKYEGKSNKV